MNSAPRVLAIFGCFCSIIEIYAADLTSLPELPAGHLKQPASDWLLVQGGFKAGLYRSTNKKELILSNGLLRRHFRLSPNAATVALDCVSTGESLLRSVRPEAVLELDGTRYSIGGLLGQPVHNFLKKDWVDNLTNQPGSFE